MTVGVDVVVGVAVDVAVLVGVGVSMGDTGGDEESNIVNIDPLACSRQASITVSRTADRMTSPRRRIEIIAIARFLLCVTTALGH